MDARFIAALEQNDPLVPGPEHRPLIDEDALMRLAASLAVDLAPPPSSSYPSSKLHAELARERTNRERSER